MKKIIPAATAALSLVMLLSACSPANPTPSQTPNVPENTPPAIVEPSVEPTISPTDEPSNPDMGYVDMNQFLTNTTYESPLGFSIYLPDSWAEKIVVTQKALDDEFGSDVFFAQKDSGDALGYLLVLHTAKTEDVINEFGEDYISISTDEMMVLGEKDGYVIYVTWPDPETNRNSENDVIAQNYDEMLSHKDELNWYIPETPYVPEYVQPVVDAITKAIGEEMAGYNPPVADPKKTMYLDLLGLTMSESNIVNSFAISASMMNVKAYTVAVIKPADGQMDAVIGALEEYKANTIQSFENYLPDQLAIAQEAIVETVGDYAVIVMCEDAQTVFDSISKDVKDYHYIVDNTISQIAEGDVPVDSDIPIKHPTDGTAEAPSEDIPPTETTETIVD